MDTAHQLHPKERTYTLRECIRRIIKRSHRVGRG